MSKQNKETRAFHFKKMLLLLFPLPSPPHLPPPPPPPLPPPLIPPLSPPLPPLLPSLLYPVFNPNSRGWWMSLCCLQSELYMADKVCLFHSSPLVSMCLPHCELDLPLGCLESGFFWKDVH